MYYFIMQLWADCQDAAPQQCRLWYAVMECSSNKQNITKRTTDLQGTYQSAWMIPARCSKQDVSRYDRSVCEQVNSAHAWTARLFLRQVVAMAVALPGRYPLQREHACERRCNT